MSFPAQEGMWKRIFAAWLERWCKIQEGQNHTDVHLWVCFSAMMMQADAVCAGLWHRLLWDDQKEGCACSHLTSCCRLAVTHASLHQSLSRVGKKQPDKPPYREQITVRQDRAWHVMGALLGLCVCVSPVCTLIETQVETVRSNRYNLVLWTYLKRTSLQGMAQK